MDRKSALNQLYALFETLERRVGGMQRLADCDGYMDWPDRGVYFFRSSEADCWSGRAGAVKA